MLSSYRDLLVWQKAMELVVETYRLSSRFPKEETVWINFPTAASQCVSSF